jgi:hypothetical protein
VETEKVSKTMSIRKTNKQKRGKFKKIMKQGA